MNICCLSPVSQTPLVLFHHIHFFTYQGIFFGRGGFCPRGILAEGVFVQGGFCPRWVFVCPGGVLSKVGYVVGGFCPRWVMS